MKLLIVILSLSLLTFSCGKKSGGSSPDVTLPQQTVVVGDVGNDSRLVDLSISLDLSNLNQEVDVQSLIGTQYCNLKVSNSTPNGLGVNSVLVSSDDGGRTGTMRFGHLKNRDGSTIDQVCRLFSDESFTFIFDGVTLEITSDKYGTTNTFTRL